MRYQIAPAVSVFLQRKIRPILAFAPFRVTVIEHDHAAFDHAGPEPYDAALLSVTLRSINTSPPLPGPLSTMRATCERPITVAAEGNGL
jgi:hypothetical protein